MLNRMKDRVRRPSPGTVVGSLALGRHLVAWSRDGHANVMAF